MPGANRSERFGSKAQPSGNKVVNVAQINVADTNAPAVTINGSDPIEFQTYVDPICNNSGNLLTINAPMKFFGTMGTAA